jgi:hypothetical protein
MSVLVIPIDASQVPEGDRKQQRVRVAVNDGSGVKSQIVAVEQGKAEIKLDVDPKQALSIAVGPESASDEDIFHMQTLTATVSPNQWAEGKPFTLSPLILTPIWWRLWLTWCREFVINGRLMCADGSPVPGAEVTAYDVDFFWWWSSISQVGPAAVTDASGHFTIKFRWCCYWWPWWWWRLRHWRLDPILIERIQPVLKLNPNFRAPAMVPTPSLDFGSLNPQPLPPRPTKLAASLAVQREIDPSNMPVLRDRLLKELPQVPELERLRIWPWWPWTPWFDCAPDIIFRATQLCGGQLKVVLDENIFQTRWDIPTQLSVNLTANQEACCLPQTQPPPPGDCALITGVCGDPGVPLTSIGGNAGTGGPVGYADPGGRDRPFSESIYVSGQFGSGAQADYYEIEYTPNAAGAWAPVPPNALLDMYRGYFDATLAWPNQWVYPIPFPVKHFGSKNVYQSRHYYEVTHPPANWGNALSGRTWYYNVNQIAEIQTAGIFADGAYDFRVVGYKALANGDLDPTTRKVLDGCGNNPHNNMLTLYIDNRFVGAQTPGTVHVNTTEPDCGISAVRISTPNPADPHLPPIVITAEPCGAHTLAAHTPLEIDFFVTDNPTGPDPNAHLDHYELTVKYDLGSITNLLNPAEVGTLSYIAGAGVSVGPDYSNAVTHTVNPPNSANRPHWVGGNITLHIDDASKVFPKTCCYLIELTVWKRNIVNCDGHLTYYNQMHYSFTITV